MSTGTKNPVTTPTASSTNPSVNTETESSGEGGSGTGKVGGNASATATPSSTNAVSETPTNPSIAPVNPAVAATETPLRKEFQTIQSKLEEQLQRQGTDPFDIDPSKHQNLVQLALNDAEIQRQIADRQGKEITTEYLRDLEKLYDNSQKRIARFNYQITALDDAIKVEKSIPPLTSKEEQKVNEWKVQRADIDKKRTEEMANSEKLKQDVSNKTQAKAQQDQAKAQAVQAQAQPLQPVQAADTKLQADKVPPVASDSQPKPDNEQDRTAEEKARRDAEEKKRKDEESNVSGKTEDPIKKIENEISKLLEEQEKIKKAILEMDAKISKLDAELQELLRANPQNPDEIAKKRAELGQLQTERLDLQQKNESYSRIISQKNQQLHKLIGNSTPESSSNLPPISQEAVEEKQRQAKQDDLAYLVQRTPAQQEEMAQKARKLDPLASMRITTNNGGSWNHEAGSLAPHETGVGFPGKGFEGSIDNAASYTRDMGIIGGKVGFTGSNQFQIEAKNESEAKNMFETIIQKKTKPEDLTVTGVYYRDEKNQRHEMSAEKLKHFQERQERASKGTPSEQDKIEAANHIATKSGNEILAREKRIAAITGRISEIDNTPSTTTDEKLQSEKKSLQEEGSRLEAERAKNIDSAIEGYGTAISNLAATNPTDSSMLDTLVKEKEDLVKLKSTMQQGGGLNIGNTSPTLTPVGTMGGDLNFTAGEKKPAAGKGEMDADAKPEKDPTKNLNTGGEKTKEEGSDKAIPVSWKEFFDRLFGFTAGLQIQAMTRVSDAIQVRKERGLAEEAQRPERHNALVKREMELDQGIKECSEILTGERPMPEGGDHEKVQAALDKAIKERKGLLEAKVNNAEKMLTKVKHDKAVLTTGLKPNMKLSPQGVKDLKEYDEQIERLEGIIKKGKSPTRTIEELDEREKKLRSIIEERENSRNNQTFPPGKNETIVQKELLALQKEKKSIIDEKIDKVEYLKKGTLRESRKIEKIPPEKRTTEQQQKIKELEQRFEKANKVIEGLKKEAPIYDMGNKITSGETVTDLAKSITSVSEPSITPTLEGTAPEEMQQGQTDTAPISPIVDEEQPGSAPVTLQPVISPVPDKPEPTVLDTQSSAPAPKQPQPISQPTLTVVQLEPQPRQVLDLTKSENFASALNGISNDSAASQVDAAVDLPVSNNPLPQGIVQGNGAAILTAQQLDQKRETEKLAATKAAEQEEETRRLAVEAEKQKTAGPSPSPTQKAGLG